MTTTQYHPHPIAPPGRVMIEAASDAVRELIERHPHDKIDGPRGMLYIVDEKIAAEAKALKEQHGNIV